MVSRLLLFLSRLSIIAILIGILIFANSCGSSGGGGSSQSSDLPYQIANVGRAPFALTSPNFPCDEFYNSLGPLGALHVSFLYNTFGNDFTCLNRIIDDGRLKTLQVHLINEPCQRNKRCGPYEFLAPIASPSEYDALLRANDQALHAKFIQYIEPLKEQINSLPGDVSCLVSPGLESNVSKEAATTLTAWAREEFPRCRIVWNPLRADTGAATGEFPSTGADLLEGHGSTPQVPAPCVVNLDGTDIDFPTRQTSAKKGAYIESGKPLSQWIHTYAPRCEAVFLWVAEDNCNGGAGTKFIDPRSRNCRKNLAVHDLAVAEILEASKEVRHVDAPWTADEELSLVDCDLTNSANDGFKEGFLLKQSEFRERGGVVILPSYLKASEVVVLHNGAVLDTYKSSGTYDHDSQGRQLFRSLKSPVTYPPHVVVRAKTQLGQVCYQIDNPKARND